MKLIIILGLFFLLFPSKVLAHLGEKATIIITNNGFQPKEVEIKLGEKVEFHNQSSAQAWPASNIHPTHRIYPEFDIRRPLNPGENWVFQFDRAGQWLYHDHLHPALGGKIKVTGGNQTLDKGSGRIDWKTDLGVKIKDKVNIWLQKVYFEIFPRDLEERLGQVNFQKIAKDKKQVSYWLQILGPEKTIEKLVTDSAGGSVVDCHQEAHLFGRTAYWLWGADAFRGSNPVCHSGFVHGAMEGFLAEKGTNNLAQNIRNLCSKFSTRFSNFECLHGVGHGVLAFENYDMPEALKTCQKLGDGFARDSCYGGLFMENIVVAEGNGAVPAHETNWVSADPHFPCNGIDQDREIQRQCYYMQTSRMLNLFGHDYQKIVVECNRAPIDMVAACFQSLGRDVAGQSLRSAEKILEVCQMVPAGYFDYCVDGGLNVIVDFWGGKMTDQPMEVCRILPDNSSKAHCYAVLAGRLKDIFPSPNEIQRHCQFAEDKYRGVCLGKKRVE